MISPGIGRLLSALSSFRFPGSPVLRPAAATCPDAQLPATDPQRGWSIPRVFAMSARFPTRRPPPVVELACVEVDCQSGCQTRNAIHRAAQSVVLVRASRTITQEQHAALQRRRYEIGAPHIPGILGATEDAPPPNIPADPTPQAPTEGGNTRDLHWSGSGGILPLSILGDGLVRHLPESLVQGHPEHVYLVMTNHHVANQAEKIFVTLADGTEVEAFPLKSPVNGAPVMDAVTDTAFLVINANRELPTLHVATGETLHALESTNTIFTAGHPRGLPKVTITRGEVSQPWQSTGTHPFTVIQFTASLNPGNSGGPLLSETGEILGINTFKLEGENMNFAIPVNLAILSGMNLWRFGRTQWSAVPVIWAPFDLPLRQKMGFDDQVTRTKPGINHGAIVARVGTNLPEGAAPQHLQAKDVVTHMKPRFGRSIPRALRRILGEFPWLAKRGNTRIRFSSPHELSDLLGRFLPLPPGTPVDVWFFRPTGDDSQTATWSKIMTDRLGTIPFELPSGESEQTANSLAWDTSSAMFLSQILETVFDPPANRVA